MLRVTELNVYPVKGCRGTSVERLRLDRRGPEGDRRFMVVDGDGQFISQRGDPRLCLVDVKISADSLTLSVTGTGASVEIPRRPMEGAWRSVTVWQSTVDAVEIREGSRFLTAHLGREAELVYMPDSTERPVNPDHAAPGDLVSFADGYPLLAVSEESLAELNRRLTAAGERAMPMARFRPNLVLAGGAPHDEDALGTFDINGVEFRNVTPCERCSVTTVDPATGERGKEPLKTLATYRKRGGAVFFGTNLIHGGEGEISVGDTITTLS